MSDEIKLTDQRPRTTHHEIPEKLRAIKPLPKDPALVEFIEKLREQFRQRLRKKAIDSHTADE